MVIMNMESSFRIKVIQFLEKWCSWVKTTTFRMRVAAWTHNLVEFPMFHMIMTYLTEIWKLDITRSAAIINGFKGVEAIMPIGMAFFADAFMGEYWMLVLSGFAYSWGASILLQLLSKSERNSCPARMRPDRIGNLQKFLFFMALTLKALGVCGRNESLISFLERESQNQTPTDKDDDQKKKRRRSFDKDVVIVQIQTPDEKAEHISKRTELEDAKIFARMIPLWITFIMCGVVSSIGDTYFLEQADKMQKLMVGGYMVPSFILLIFHGITKFVFRKLFAVVAKKLFEKGFGKSIFPIGVIAAMLFSVVCCVIAAEVETRRLEYLTEGLGLLSMFWLLPQYCFLAAIDGISDYLCGDLEKVSGYSIACFCIASEYSSSVSFYLRLFTNAAFGLGHIGSTISVQAAGKFSGIGRSSSWFQETLNKSHLDYYYLTLAALSSINLVLCILVSIWYIHQHLKAMIDELFTTHSMVKKLLGTIFSFHIFSLN